jgi:coronin-1B/1C/6
VSFFDPRQGSTVSSASAHDGARQQKVTFLGDSDHIMTCGFSKLSEREFAIQDVRKFGTPLVKRRLDEYGGVGYLQFDEEHKVVFVAGKGENAITYHQFNPSNPNLIEYLGAFKGKEPQKGFSFLPKRLLDVNSNEVAKAVRMTNYTIEYVSFHVPRRGGGFNADLYPPVRASDAASSADDYFGGKNSEPLRVQLKPDNAANYASSSSKSVTFTSSPSVATNNVPTHVPAASTQANKDEIDALNKKIQSLSEDLKAAHNQISNLQSEVQALTQKNESLT